MGLQSVLTWGPAIPATGITQAASGATFKQNLGNSFFATVADIPSLLSSGAAFVMLIGRRVDRPSPPPFGTVFFDVDEQIQEVWDGEHWRVATTGKVAP